jgi:AraC-like DNA-binding protein
MSTSLDGAPIVLEPGDVILSPTWASEPLYPVDRNSVGVKASFRPCAMGTGFERTRVSRLSRAALSEIHDALASAPTSDADACARGCAVAEVLGAHGVPVLRDEVDRACNEVREVDRAFAKLVAAGVFPLARRTTLHDLARGLFRGERQVIRTSNEFFRRYFASVRSYREFAAGWRIAGAFALLSRGAASVEEVAADVGFSSGAALCHAFKRVGVPSPAVIQARYAAP